MLSEREALEAAIVANPDNLATHYAYADWLIEHDDPRGEFIRIQLAAERKPNSLVSPDIDAESYLQQRDEQARQLLKELYVYSNLSKEGYQKRDGIGVSFRRGWIDHLIFKQISDVQVASLQDLDLRCLSGLYVQSSSDLNSYEALWQLPMPNLKTLLVNDRLFTDDDVEMLIRQSYIAQLFKLDLDRCSMTDSGATALAWALEKQDHRPQLSLAHNYISPAGRADLATAGYVVSEQQDIRNLPYSYTVHEFISITEPRPIEHTDSDDNDDNPRQWM